MNKKNLLLLYTFFLTIFFFASGHYARAATMYLLPDTRSIGVGQEFNIDIKIDTNNASSSINSAEATIQFPVDIVNALSIDKQNSSFGFWLEEPTISNNNGTIHFIGGAIKGISGSALQVVRIKFKAMGVGSSDFKIANAEVMAADGRGTNVLSAIQGTSVVVGINNAPPLIISYATTTAEQPIQIDRIAVPAKKIPVNPLVRVPLYPNESHWYNHVGDVIVLWDLPADITQVAARISKIKNNTVGTPEKTLSNGKNLGILDEGIWYIRVQFKNNVGWSEPTYYKISIDTTVPLPFDIKIDSVISDNPSPTIEFGTNDSLSGIANYTVAVDGNELVVTTSTTMKLPVGSPGKHTLVVKANDFSGNSVQDRIEFEILPLPTPQIEFITRSVYQKEFIFASGVGISNGSVDIRIASENGKEVFNGSVRTGSEGHWDITIEEPLAIGTYLFSAISRDTRGAMSIASAPETFSIKAERIISFGFIELGWFEILIVTILLIATGASVWSRRYVIRKQKRGRYNIIMGRDIGKLTDLMSENMKELTQNLYAKRGVDIPHLAHIVDRMNENIARIKKYITQELEKLK